MFLIARLHQSGTARRPPHPALKASTALALLATLAALAAAGPAVAASCSVSASGLLFGAYQPLVFPGKLSSQSVDSTATISVVCAAITGGGAYTIALGPSQAGSGNRISVRYMVNSQGGDLMMFNVYTDPLRTLIWGDGVTAGNLIGGQLAAGNSNLSVSVYGRIPAGQSTLKAGSFSASLPVTLTYNP